MNDAKKTGIYAVIGNPVEHSLSPRIHHMFAKQTGQDINYTRILAPLEGFVACVDEFAASGASGANVTVPFKFEALTLAFQATDRARLAGAANILRFDASANTLPVNERCWADNTDGAGLVRDITQNAGVDLTGQRILLIGAGGAAAGVLGPLIEAKPKAVHAVNRSLPKAQQLNDKHRQLAEKTNVVLQASDLSHCEQGYDVVINATSTSLAGAGIPVPASVLKARSLALDMMYGPAAQPFLDWARTHNAHGRDGLGMLVEQAAESFYFWRGVRPDGQLVLSQLGQELS